MKRIKGDTGLYALALLRIGLGYMLLWAFFDKLLGLKYATCAGKELGCSAAWVNGGSPTSGFLGHATTGPLADFYHSLAQQAWVDWMFMLGLLFAGVGLFFGTWIKSAAATGIAMFLLMWSSLLWPENTPGIDEHIIYVLALLIFLCGSFPQKWTIKIPGLKLP